MNKDIKHCVTCKHWNATTHYEYPNAINDGVCPALKSELDILLHLGWDGGYVEVIETRSNFGCVLHEEK